MNRNFTLASCLVLPALMIGAGLYNGMQAADNGPGIAPVSPQLLQAIKSKKSAPLRTLARTDYFFEDFEDTDYENLRLPEGWTTTATPGQSDAWGCGTLGDSYGDAINGVSGWQYAFVLGTPDGSDHDTWLFSPAIELTEGLHYLDFFAYMPEVPGEGINSSLEVYVCTAPDRDSVLAEVVKTDEALEYWSQFVRAFEVDLDTSYHIAFRCTSPGNANAMMIDNVRVSDGMNPEYYGDTAVDFGTIDSRAGKGYTFMEVYNSGNGDLKIDLKECSPELELPGAPFTLGEGASQLPVMMTCSEPGEYEGYIILTTNDPLHPEVKLNVYATVKEYSVTTYLSESFEQGQPVDWDMTRLSFILTAYGAQDGGAAWYSSTSYSSGDGDFYGIGFTTNYIELGANPEVSFWYKAYQSDWTGKVTGPAMAEEVVGRVFVSTTGGGWDEVYTISPEATPHNPVTDFQLVSFALPQHKNETCRLRVVFSSPCGSYELLIDNIKAGTAPESDIEATALTGPTTLKVGEDAEYSVNLKNNGLTVIDGATLQLKDLTDGQVLATYACPEMEALAEMQFPFTWQPAQARYHHLVVEAVVENDPEPENNVSYPLHLSVLDADNTTAIIDHGKRTLEGGAYPVNFNSLEAKTQTLYYANEIGTDRAEINSICYTSVLTAPYMSDLFTIYVAETDREDFSDGCFVDDSLFTKVFEGKVYFLEGTNKFVVPFETPYNYQGGNLVVMAERKADNFMYGINYLNMEVDTPRSLTANGLKNGAVFGNPDRDVTVAYAYPRIGINMTAAPNGNVSGVVTDRAGAPLSGAKVQLKGTGLYALTGTDGTWSLPKVAAGEVAFDVTCHGYYPTGTEKADLGVAQQLTINTEMTPYPLAVVAGTVTDKEGANGISNVTVTLEGYDSYRATTDSDGSYRIEGVTADTGTDYAMTYTNPYFKTVRRRAAVTADTTADVKLEAKPSHPNNLKTDTDEATSCTLSWKEPLPEYSHDSGVPGEFIGWPSQGPYQIVGAKFLRNTTIEEVSWYVSSTPAGHDTFNVIIFGLYPDGSPNPNNILYLAEDVDYVDDAWSTHRLTRKVTADGYMVAISCNGFMSMGLCLPTEDTPFAVGQDYYAGDTFLYHISEMSTYTEGHFMVRAYGMDNGEWSGAGTESSKTPAQFAGKPQPVYNIYRFAAGQSRAQWQKIATTAGTSYTDAAFVDLDKGDVRYAVTADYDGTESIESVSYIISKTTDGIMSVAGDEVRISLRNGSLVTDRPELITSIQLYDLAGRCLAAIDNPGTTVALDGIAADTLIAVVTDIDGNTRSFKVIR